MAALNTSPSLKIRPYEGDRVGIVIGIDFGTTFSGVSYAFLHPSQTPELQGVTEFRGQATGDSKVPSVMYYDEGGVMRAAGAETTQTETQAEAEDEDWTRIAFFKLHLRPTEMPLDANGLNISDLPQGKTAEEVVGDFLRYLLDETAFYIQNRHADGPQLWEQVKDRAQFVLGHPNGWVGQPQQRLRRSAICGGLIPDTEEGRARVTFVTEGEASALACLACGLGPRSLTRDFRFLVLDAGGGTLDVTSYRVSNTDPIELEEIATPDCRFAGSIFVNKAAKELLRRVLKNSRYDDENVLDQIIDDAFERQTKRQFKDNSKIYYVRVDTRATDKARGIKAGLLSVRGMDISDCFTLSVNEALDSIRSQLKKCKSDAMPVWLVGGFAASPWLLKQLRQDLEPLGCTVQRPETNQSKAVADGAVLHYLSRTVKSRVARHYYGTRCMTVFDPLDDDHIAHRHLVQRSLLGIPVIGPVFDSIVQKDSSVLESTTYCETYSKTVPVGLKEFATIDAPIYIYDGEPPLPRWMGEQSDRLRTLCTLHADLSSLCKEPARNYASLLGPSFWRLQFDIEISFGSTELIAGITWMENGQRKRGPTVEVVYRD